MDRRCRSTTAHPLCHAVGHLDPLCGVGRARWEGTWLVGTTATGRATVADVSTGRSPPALRRRYSAGIPRGAPGRSAAQATASLMLTQAREEPRHVLLDQHALTLVPLFRRQVVQLDQLDLPVAQARLGEQVGVRAAHDQVPRLRIDQPEA